MANSIDVSKLSQYAGKHEKKLISSMVNGLDVAKDIRVRPNVKSSEKVGTIKVNPGLRPFSSKTEFKDGDIEYGDELLTVKPAKRELLIDPESYRGTYLEEFLSPGSGAKKKEIPFAEYTWQKVVESIASEVNDEAAWHGFDRDGVAAFNPAESYQTGDTVFFKNGETTDWHMATAAVDAGQSPATNPEKWRNVTGRAICEGFGAKFGRLVSEGRIAPISTGPITRDDAHEQFKAFFRQMPAPARKNGAVILCSLDDFDALCDALEDKFKGFRQEKGDFRYLPNTMNKCLVKPCTWINGEKAPLIGQATMSKGSAKGRSLVMGTDLLGDMGAINTNQVLWTLEVGIKFVLGFQVRHPEETWINDNF